MKNSIKMAAGICVLLLMASMNIRAQEAETKVKTVEGKPVSGNALTLLTVTGESSSNETVTTQRSTRLIFDGASSPSEVKVNITDDNNFLGIRISSEFYQGRFTLELIDPKGNKRGTYILKSDDAVVTGSHTESSESVNGSLAKDFINPEKGTWIIKAIPQSARGKMEVKIIQKSRPDSAITGTAVIEATPVEGKSKSSGIKKNR
jgi:hypothetical protein